MFRISHYNVIKNPVFEFCLKLFEKNPTLLGNKNTAFDHVSSGVCVTMPKLTLAYMMKVIPDTRRVH
jgi:hypothetical protein